MPLLKSLYLKNFRNYSRAEINLGPNLNVFIGLNGQGKTNCLEAIALLISGRSFRTSFLKELIQSEKQAFEVQAHFDRFGIDQRLKLYYGCKKHILEHNETSYPSFSPLIGLLQGVFFSSFQNGIIRGSASLRRRFLDLQNAQIDPLYLHHLRRYQKALKERNALLKQKKLHLLEVYEELMAQSAPYIVHARKVALQSLANFAQVHMHELSNQKEKLSMEYQLYAPKEGYLETFEDYLRLYQKSRSRDIKWGFTTLGPHKDDALITLNGLEAKKFASEGQVQTLMSSIYLAEFDRLKQATTDEDPLFCIDDISQNLDQQRLKKLYSKLSSLGQVFVTTPELPSVVLPSNTRCFEIKDGIIHALKDFRQQGAVV